MHGFDTAGLPEWKVSLLLAMTLVVVMSAHWHSYCAARREVKARDLPTRLGRILSYVARHEIHYVKQVPLMMFFVAASVVVVARL